MSTATTMSSAPVRRPVPRGAPALSSVLMLVAIYILEAGAAVTLFSVIPVDPLVDILLAFAFHLAAACLVSYGFFGPWDFRRAEEKNWAVIGFVLVLSTPVYGLLGYTGAFFAVRARRRGRSMGDILTEFNRYIAYEPEAEELIARAAAMTPLTNTPSEDDEPKGEIAPLVDVLKSGDRELKRGAIFSAARLDVPTAVRVLRDSLADGDREIQFYAAGQLSRIEKTFGEAIIKCRRAIELTPNDARLHARLAAHCREYAESGLVESTVRRYFLRQATAACFTALEHEPRWLEVRVELAGLLRLQGERDAALEEYRRVLESDPNQIAARVGLCHAYFEQRDFARLGAVLHELDARGQVPEELRAVFEFWRAEGHAD